ncbi:MAG: hypothetical protein NZ888_06410 [Candidatus Nitrosocaldus sp.]|nr:hypothetical protein [Candidatus Nitrosocaldus sp.]MDW8000476.1 hypothetical protein [Candidatus Nitrosocaldus sp.]
MRMMVVALIPLLLAYTCVSGTTYAVVVEDRHLNLVSTVIMIRGHLAQAVENKSNGNDELAVAHSGHPASELFMLIMDDVAGADADLAREIEGALESLPARVPSMDADELRDEVSRIDGLLHSAVSNDAILPEEKRSDVRFWATVMLNVLEHAYEEYSEGVEVEGEVANMIEWQDSIGFTTILVEDTFPAMLKNRLDAELSAVVEQSLDELLAEMRDKASAERIGSLVDSIGAMVDALILKDEHTAPDIRRVKELLDLALKSYQAGKFEEEEEGEYSEALANYERAKELVVKAYREHFEPLKPHIEAVDPALMQSTETMFMDLMDLMDGAAPVEHVRAKIEQIDESIDRMVAVGVVPEFPAGIVAVVLASITGIGVLLNRFRSR